MHNQNLRILLTEGSSTSARHVLYALGPRHTVDILDPNHFCQCRFSRYVRRHFVCPSVSRDPAAYLELLLKRLSVEKYDVLFPTHEQIYLLARYREELERYVHVALPDFESLDRVIGKADFVRVLRELDLPHPKTEIARSRSELLETTGFPCFVKLDHSTAGEGVRRVCNRSDLERVASEFEAKGWLDGTTEVLVQQQAPGDRATVTGIFRDGNLVGTHCAVTRALALGGWGMAQVSVNDPAAIEHLRRLGSNLDWHGAMVLEYIRDPITALPQFIECNPRIGETFNATISGVNLCEQLVRVSLGEKVGPLPMGRVGLRSHQGFIVLLAKALKGNNRLQLIAELIRHGFGQDLYNDSEEELTRTNEDWLSAIPAWAVSLQLLLYPKIANRIVRRTVENYCINETAIRQIRNLPRHPAVSTN